MANEVHINHAFVSTKSDSSDSSLVSKTKWNADELISGGSDGQVVVKDSTSVTGGRYIQGPSSSEASAAYSGASPSTELCSTAITFSTNTFCQVGVLVTAVTNNASAYNCSLRRDGVDVETVSVASGSGTQQVINKVFTETPGTHTYSIRFTTTGGATITSSSEKLVALTIGRL